VVVLRPVGCAADTASSEERYTLQSQLRQVPLNCTCIPSHRTIDRGV
jgi:hypothetical protein